MVAFFTLAYFEELARVLNADPDFKQKTANLNLTIVMSAKDKDVHGLLRIQNGQATAQAAKPDEKADFKFIADYATWSANHRGEAPLDKLVMTGKVKFIGSIPKIMGLRNQLLVIDRVAQGIAAEL